MAQSVQLGRSAARTRAAGSLVGLMVGVALILYIDAQKPHAEPKHANAAPSLRPTASQETQIVESPSVSIPRATIPRIINVTEPRLAIEAERALELFEQSRRPQDPPRPETMRYLQMSPKEMEAEVKAATSQTAQYTMEGIYAHEHHAALYRKVNILWDVPRLTDRQNRWLAQAVGELNKLATRHAREAWREKDGEAAVRTVAVLAEWGYRLDEKEEERMKMLLEAAAADARARENAGEFGSSAPDEMRKPTS